MEHKQPVNNPYQKLSYHNLAWPTDWQSVFGDDRPLILEIGFGYGQYLRHLTRQHPESSIIGLEISNVCLEKAEGAMLRGELPDRVRVVYVMAETALHHLFAPQSLSEIHINFPDPWFKTRHGHRRLIQRDTVDAMISRLRPDGKLYLATDILAYAEMSAEVFAHSPALTNLHDTPWVHAMPGRVITKYEAKAAREGRPCYYFAYRRNTHPAPAVPVITESPMPHLVFETPLSLETLLADFTAGQHHDGDIHINYLLAYRGPESVLYEVYVHEPTIEQRVALLLVKIETHYTLRLSTIGTPRPTAGIHVAVRHLGERLVSLHPDARITQWKVRESL